MTAERSARKTATTRYSDDRRVEALDLMRQESLAAAHDATGIPKPTLSRWAKDAGIDLGGRAREQTAAAAARVRERAARIRLETVEALTVQIAEAGTYLTEIAQANAEAAELLGSLPEELITIDQNELGTTLVVADDATAAAIKRAHALASLPLSVPHAVGMRTRAIHDLQLLRGEAIERGEVRVEFAVPRPDTSAPTVRQADLSRLGFADPVAPPEPVWLADSLGKAGAAGRGTLGSGVVVRGFLSQAAAVSSSRDDVLGQ